MRRRERVYEDDDGRTVADMSGVPRPGFLRSYRTPEDSRMPSKNPWPPAVEPESDSGRRPWEDHSLSREEGRMYVFGALKAALLIGLAFIGGLGFVTAFLLWVWR